MHLLTVIFSSSVFFLWRYDLHRVLCIFFFFCLSKILLCSCAFMMLLLIYFEFWLYACPILVLNDFDSCSLMRNLIIGWQILGCIWFCLFWLMTHTLPFLLYRNNVLVWLFPYSYFTQSLLLLDIKMYQPFLFFYFMGQVSCVTKHVILVVLLV